MNKFLKLYFVIFFIFAGCQSSVTTNHTPEVEVINKTPWLCKFDITGVQKKSFLGRQRGYSVKMTLKPGEAVILDVNPGEYWLYWEELENFRRARPVKHQFKKGKQVWCLLTTNLETIGKIKNKHGN